MHKKHPVKPLRRAALFIACLFLSACGASAAANSEVYTTATFAMDTLIDQQAYGPAAQDAMREVNIAFAAYEKRLSLYGDAGDIAAINAAAGKGGAVVSDETAALLRHGLALSAGTEGAFALTIAPLSLAWGIMSDAPRVPPQSELDALLPLVDDGAVVIEGNRVMLPAEGMGFDLGGIAKGAACGLAADIYAEHGVQNAVLNIGGNVYARGTKPDGTPFRVGFADPQRRAESAYIASFPLQDAVVAVSGATERYADIGGRRYAHIIDPRTGYPVESDILSVGVICEDGAEADLYSTTLYVWGVQRALEYMRAGGTAIVLDHAHNLYVSQSLEGGFELADGAEYNLTYIPQEDGQ